MQQLILMFHVLIAVALVILILLQQGKGAEMGAAFGSGASQTLFGSRGSGSFLMKVTGALGFLFFLTSLTLGYLTAQQAKIDPLQALSKMQIKNTAPPTMPTLPVQQNSIPANSSVPQPVIPPKSN